MGGGDRATERENQKDREGDALIESEQVKKIERKGKEENVCER